MSDLFDFELAWDLDDALPDDLLAELRWQLEPDPGEERLLSQRGPAWRIGGTLHGALVRTRRGWSLTVRQELHAECLDDLAELLARLAAHSGAEGPVGRLRFYEDEVPDLLVVRAGAMARQAPGATAREAVPFLDGLTGDNGA